MSKIFTKNNRGFTFIETMIALFIFTMAVLAMMSIMSKGISDTGYAKRKLIAAYLAQEGVEYIRNLRDTYILYNASSSQAGWNAFVTRVTTTADCDGGNGCYFNDQALNFSDLTQPIVDIAVATCGSSCPTLLYNSATGRYNYTAGESSGFSRKISVILTNANEVKILSTVSWTEKSRTYQIISSEVLFNWI